MFNRKYKNRIEILEQSLDMTERMLKQEVQKRVQIEKENMRYQDKIQTLLNREEVLIDRLETALETIDIQKGKQNENSSD